jgi:hypothetical protein
MTRTDVQEISMKNATSIWTAVLTFSAVILAVILLSGHSQQADAAMLNAQADFSLMTTGAAGGDEFLVVIDKTQQKMIAYRVQANEMVPLTGANFGR